MKLTVGKIIGLYNGLNSLDNYDRAVGDKVVKELYQLGGPFRLNVARNLNKLEPEVTAFRQARNALVKQHTNGSGTDMVGFVDAERELLDNEVDMELITFKERDLVLEKNPIPGSVLALIMPILEE